MNNQMEKAAVYACRHKNTEVRKKSTSGGVFSALAEKAAKRAAVICGAAFESGAYAAHRLIDTKEKGFYHYDIFRGSKYVQSDSGDIFYKIKTYLNCGREVLFTGTPCQVHGLYNVLGRSYEELLCVDFVCMGVGSPAIWNDYLDTCFPGEIIRQVVFKDKKEGWHNFRTSIRTDRRSVSGEGYQNPYMEAYLRGLNQRPSCYHCRMKGDNRKSDLTIADCWGIEKYLPEFDDNLGISCVFTNTEQGRAALSECSDLLDIREYSFKKAVKDNPYYVRSKEWAKERNDFFLKHFLRKQKT